MKIELKNIEIDQISNSSGVFTGDNIQVKWKSIIQRNEGYGSLNGDHNYSADHQSFVIKENQEVYK